MSAAMVRNPADAMAWFDLMKEQRWTFAWTPSLNAPEAMAAYREFRADRVVDVTIVRSAEYAYGYRAILTASPDPFAPNFVLWTYSDNAVHVLRAALAMPAPGLFGAPTVHRPVPTHLTEVARPFVLQRVVRRP